MRPNTGRWPPNTIALPMAVGVVLAGMPLAAFSYWLDGHVEGQGRAEVQFNATRAVSVINARLSREFRLCERLRMDAMFESFNALNHVNLNNPNTTINQSSTGQIFSAGDARVMQIALKVVF